ncbi:3-hydroxy acyl-CoA dehydratase [Ceratobasidium sp. AG-Ba]|nr:3-hydroxy acyl-CoA dehydratase [Ceratobasidium sp. AG-Ba]
MLLQVPLAIKSRSILAGIQIIGRTYIIWGVVESYPVTHSNPYYALLVLAWSGSEVTKHTFDAYDSMGKELGRLIYIRYAILSVLYPLAALSEAALIFSTLPDLSPRGGKWSIYDYLRGISFVISKWSVWELVRGTFYVVSTKRSWHELLRGVMAELNKLSPLEMFRGALFVFGKLTPSELFHGVFFIIWWPGLYLVYAYVVVQRRKITKDEKPIVKSRSRLEVLRERKTK